MKLPVCGAVVAAALFVGVPTASFAVPPAPTPVPTSAISAEQARSRAALSAAIAKAAQASATAQQSSQQAKELIAAAGAAAEQASDAQKTADTTSEQLTGWTRAVYMQGSDLLPNFTWARPLPTQVHTSYIADQLSAHLRNNSENALKARTTATEKTKTASTALTRAIAAAQEATAAADAAAADQAAAAADVARADKTAAAAAAAAKAQSGGSPTWLTVRATGPLLTVASTLKDVRPFASDGPNMSSRMGEWLASDRTVVPNTARAYAEIGRAHV